MSIQEKESVVKIFQMYDIALNKIDAKEITHYLQLPHSLWSGLCRPFMMFTEINFRGLEPKLKGMDFLWDSPEKNPIKFRDAIVVRRDYLIKRITRF